jgi:hypothetical protein
VPIPIVTCVFGNERRDVIYDDLENVRILWRGHIGGGGASWRREWRDCVNQFLLQPQQVGCRLRYDAAKAYAFLRDVVLESR